MALKTRFLPYSVQIKTPSVTAWVNQIENTTPEGGVSLFEETSGSETDRQFTAISQIMSTMALATSDLTILTTCGMSGVPISSASGDPGLVMYGRELPFGAVPTAIATADHIKLACSDGLLVPVSLRASHNAVAKLALMLHAALGTDGTSGATPFVRTASVAIPTGQTATSNIFTLGPLKYTYTDGGGGSRLVDLSEANVTFGIQVLKEGNSGRVHPDHLSIIARMSKLEFSTKDTELITEVGDSLTCTAFAQYFRAVAQNGQRIAEATTSHVSVSSASGMLTPGATSLTHKQAGTSSYTYTPSLSTNLLSISASAAIPTS